MTIGFVHVSFVSFILSLCNVPSDWRLMFTDVWHWNRICHWCIAHCVDDLCTVHLQWHFMSLRCLTQQNFALGFIPFSCI